MLDSIFSPHMIADEERSRNPTVEIYFMKLSCVCKLR